MDFGFLDNLEYIPDIYSKLSKEKLSRVFLLLYNSNVDDEYKIPHSFSKNSVELKDIFYKFISSNLKIKPLCFAKTTKFCISSNVIIYAYLNNKNNNIHVSKIPNMKIAKILQLVYHNNNLSFFINSDTAFNNFVCKNILCRNKDNKVFIKDDIIIIKKEGCRTLGVITSFKSIHNRDANNFDVEIRKAMALSDENKIDNIYIVYPRNKNFTKHIQIKSCSFSSNFMLKVVPYSIGIKIF